MTSPSLMASETSALAAPTGSTRASAPAPATASAATAAGGQPGASSPGDTQASPDSAPPSTSPSTPPSAPPSAGTTLPTGDRAMLASSRSRPDQTMVSIDSLQRLGPVTHVGQGFLHSLFSGGPEVQWFKDLGATAWRSSIDGRQLASSNNAGWSTTQSDGVPTTLILSDMWRIANGSNRVAPWSDWNKYRLWVETTALEAKLEGYKIDYWEVYNEPDNLSRYYPPDVYATVTPDLLLQQFLVADQAITAIDGSAQIIGPSLANFDTPTTSKTFSMEQFLAFTSSQHLRLAAVSWHHACGHPAQIIREAGLARLDLDRFPQASQPRLFINEYGSAVHQRIPGWDVADLAALNESGVDQANRSCWYGDCAQPSLDGLLTPDGSAALPDYWVRLDYAGMKGERVRATSTGAGVSALAAFDPSTATISAVIGRAIGCNQDPRCPSRYRDSAPTSITVQLQVPWSSGTVVVDQQRISGQAITPTSKPAVSAASYPITPSVAGGGRVIITLTGFNDGDAEALDVNLAQ